MSQNAFLTAIQKVTSGELTLTDLIAGAQALTRAGQIDQARQLYQVWLSFNRDHALAFIAHFNCSTLLTQAGDDAGAEVELRAALARNPDFTPAHVNLGSALERRGAAKEAVEQWRAGLERLGAITGDAIEYKITLLKQISRIFTDNSQHESAEVALLQCLDLNPEQRDVAEQYGSVRLAQCKWPILSGGSRASPKSLLARFHPLSMCAYADDPLLHLGAAHRYVAAVAAPDTVTTHSDRRDAPIEIGRRLRVGYVSSDLRAHAVGYLMAQVFEEHDSSAVEVFVYYCGIPASDAIAERVKAAAEHWTDIRDIDDDEAAARIAADGIDILVDVNGHTRDARLGVFARRPAPIQVNWLGYPGTMGSAFHHYIIADDWVIPEAMELYYSERVLRLPCYQPNDTKRIVAEKRPTRTEAGLPEDAFVYCCFNAAHKITRYSAERWLEILRQAPGSVLWLLDYGAETNKRLQAFAEAKGVSGERFVFAPKLANPHHLARYPLADLFLDTAPYGAHTTASDALWMGVPVITLTGRSFASRVCGSLSRAAGLPELACDTAQHFVTRAAALAGPERATLDIYRRRLIDGRDRCTLFDVAGLVRSLEDLYRQMRADYLGNSLPRPRLANLEAYFEIGLAYDHDAREIGGLGAYHEHYQAALAARDKQTPMEPDGRLWSGAPPVSVQSAASSAQREEIRSRAASG
jgi:predicted O-linked N-acetylglucosamine transferase (SPINDLY family)